MREHGYLGDEGALTVGEVIKSRGVDRPMLTVGSHDPVGRALELMREHGVSQFPVVSGEDGRAFMGTVSERGLLMASADHPGILGEPVTEVIEPPLPELDARSPANEAIHMILGRAQAGDHRGGRPRARHPRVGGPDRSPQPVRRSEAKPSRAAVEAPDVRRSEAKPSRAAVEAPYVRRSEAKPSRAAVEAPYVRRSEAEAEPRPL